MDIAELRQRARDRITPEAFEYIARGAADGDDTMLENSAAWHLLHVRPHVLRDVSAVATATRVLGIDIAAPVLVAPTAMHQLVCDDAECATARAAARAQTIMVTSMAAHCSLDATAAAAPGAPRFAQMYVLRDRGRTRARAEQAAAAGYRAIVASVDGAAVPYGRGVRGSAPVSENVAEMVDEFDASVTIDDIVQLAEWSGLPLVVKGVLRGDDARICVDAGAAAVYVSNHGGRILDGCVATATALPDVVAAVDGRAEVYVDGGSGSGTDVLCALALGADAVLLGRPVLWGLAVDAEHGACEVLETVRAELARAMAFCGAASIGDITRDLVT